MSSRDGFDYMLLIFKFHSKSPSFLLLPLNYLQEQFAVPTLKTVSNHTFATDASWCMVLSLK